MPLNLRGPMTGLLVACLTCSSLVKPGELHTATHSGLAHFAPLHPPPHHQPHVPEQGYNTSALVTTVAAVASTSAPSSTPSLFVSTASTS